LELSERLLSDYVVILIDLIEFRPLYFQ